MIQSVERIQLITYMRFFASSSYSTTANQKIWSWSIFVWKRFCRCNFPHLMRSAQWVKWWYYSTSEKMHDMKCIETSLDHQILRLSIFNYRQRSSFSSSGQQNIYQKPSSSSQQRSQRQITYSRYSRVEVGAYFVNDKDDEWEYDSMADTYFLAGQSPHSSEHTSRAQENTHDEDDEKAYVNWAKMASGHRCNHQNCTHYHDEE